MFGLAISAFLLGADGDVAGFGRDYSGLPYFGLAAVPQNWLKGGQKRLRKNGWPFKVPNVPVGDWWAKNGWPLIWPTVFWGAD